MLDPEDFAGMLNKMLRQLGKNSTSTSVIYHHSGDSESTSPGQAGVNDSDGGGEDTHPPRTLRMTEVKDEDQGSVRVYVYVQVPRNWVRFIISNDRKGFLVRHSRESKDAFKCTYRSNRGYIYKDHSYRKGVLQVRFTDSRREYSEFRFLGY